MAHSLIEELVSRIAAANPMQRGMLDAAVAGLEPDEREQLQDYLTFCASQGRGPDLLADAYNTITLDTLREQVFFMRHGRYRHARFAEVADAVYFSDAYMQKYMYGLALTAFFWTNHRAVHRYFHQCLPAAKNGRYLEIGPGHGLFLRTALRQARYDSYLGVDISPASLAMTRALLEHEPDASGRWELRLADFLEAGALDRQYDAIVMGEVLEHVERPDLFLARIRTLAAPQAFIFVTTAINAPAVDHIYLFRTIEEVENMVQASGLKIRGRLATPYPGCSSEETVARRLPMNIALVLSV
jgi:2-polyprenyl-3-methyl-5-hydroxy-6-metoxy-1,4-benzoquinol methylase